MSSSGPDRHDVVRHSVISDSDGPNILVLAGHRGLVGDPPVDLLRGTFGGHFIVVELSDLLESSTIVDSDTISQLLARIETLRKRLAVDHWAILATSTASLLAHRYASEYRNHVAGLLLWGSYHPQDLPYFFDLPWGASRLYPEAYVDLRRIVADADCKATWQSWLALPYEQPAIICDALTAALGAITGPNARSGHELASSDIAGLLHQFSVCEELNNLPLHWTMSTWTGLPTALLHGRFDFLTPPARVDALASHWRVDPPSYVDQTGHCPWTWHGQRALVRSFRWLLDACAR